MNHSNEVHAFSLVELSIVLVILGLLAGGVLSGQSLIRAAELRSIVTDLNRIQTSQLSFRDKYFALPGDMTNATQFWGSAGGPSHTDDATCYTVSSTAKETCNGNGDGNIHVGKIPDNDPNLTYGERGHYWKQLANAGLIEGQYTGYEGPVASETRQGGVNTLRSRISGAHWNVAWVGQQPSDNARFFRLEAGNLIEISWDFTQSNSRRDFLTPAEQWNIDTKLDDSKPGTGTLQGPKKDYVDPPNTPPYNCTTSNDAATAAYNLTLGTKACFPTFYLR